MEYEREESIGYITGEQAALQFFQKGMTAAFSIGFDGLMNGFEIPGTENFLGGFEGIGGFMGENPLAMGLESMFSGMVQGNFNSWVNAFELDGNGGWDWNGEAYTEGAWGKGAWAGYVGSFVGSSVTSAVNGAINNVDLQGFDTGGQEIIKSLQNNVGKISSTIGGIAGEAFGAILDGEFTLNILNVSDILSFFIPDEKPDGMSQKEYDNLLRIRNRTNIGLLEVGLGFNERNEFGLRSRIGSGGANINITALMRGFRALGRIDEINTLAIEAKAEEDQRLLAEVEQAQTSEQPPIINDPNVQSTENNEPNAGNIVEEGNEVSLDSFVEESNGEITEEDVRELERQIAELDDTPENKFQKLIRSIHGEDSVRRRKAVDLLIQLIGEEDVNKASGFMKDMVQEEGLVAYDFMKFALEVIEAGEITQEAVQSLKVDVDQVTQLSDDFKAALSEAIGLSKAELLDAIRLNNNTDISTFNERISILQDAGLINDHMIFNPFDQDNFDENQLAELAARQRILEDNALAMSRMILVQEGDKRYFYIIDNIVDQDWVDDNPENDEGAWSKTEANVYKVEVRSNDPSIPEGISWQDGALVIDQNQFPSMEGLSGTQWIAAVNAYRENIFNNDNLVGKAGDLYFTANREEGGESLGISIEDARHAGYRQRVYDSLMNRISTKAGDFFDENNNLIPSKLFNVGNDRSWRTLVNQYEQLMADPKYQALETLRDNGYSIIRSNTWCNVGARGYAFEYYEYYKDQMNFNSQSEFTSAVGNSLNPITDTLGYHDAFVKVSLEYAALWGKTNALSFGRMFSTNGKPGHISMFTNIGMNNGDSSLYADNDVYEYYFSNIGEWNGYNITLNRAWGAYTDVETGLRNLNRFKKNVQFFVLAPEIR
jgi:hypothetical protein